jgi:rhamnopyranosyl-N-acetylglucosaminyl-diphospho-decaprenol beta-1,3/1,4-galactofuranosyltransferase
MKKIKVCAVIVTFNRKELLLRCINSLLNQDYTLDILVYDNHSTDNTNEFLNKYGVMDKIKYIYADKNTGGSGGFYNGMKIAMGNDYDYLWLMDDDGYAYSNNTLSELIKSLKYVKSDKHIINSLVICNDSKELCFTLKGKKYYKDIIDLADKKGLIYDAINPFNGTLVSRKLIEKIGYPIKEFFVYGDETEYMLRARKNGAELITVTSSVYFHPSMPKIEKKIWGKVINSTDVPAWKVYCSQRNMSYVNKKYYGFKNYINFAWHSNKYILVYEKDRWYKIFMHYLGLLDGFRGNFDRTLNLSR